MTKNQSMISGGGKLKFHSIERQQFLSVKFVYIAIACPIETDPLLSKPQIFFSPSKVSNSEPKDRNQRKKIQNNKFCGLNSEGRHDDGVEYQESLEGGGDRRMRACTGTLDREKAVKNQKGRVL